MQELENRQGSFESSHTQHRFTEPAQNDKEAESRHQRGHPSLTGCSFSPKTINMGSLTVNSLSIQDISIRALFASNENKAALSVIFV